MQGSIRVACAAIVTVVVFTTPGGAAPLTHSAVAPATDLSAQSRGKKTRPQITVRPRYRHRNYNTVYPLPYDFDYPGPNARRECVARLVQEARPSGTVVVPRTRCWWVRG